MNSFFRSPDFCLSATRTEPSLWGAPGPLHVPAPPGVLCPRLLIQLPLSVKAQASLGKRPWPHSFCPESEDGPRVFLDDKPLWPAPAVRKLWSSVHPGDNCRSSILRVQDGSGSVGNSPRVSTETGGSFGACPWQQGLPGGLEPSDRTLGTQFSHCWGSGGPAGDPTRETGCSWCLLFSVVSFLGWTQAMLFPKWAPVTRVEVLRTGCSGRQGLGCDPACSLGRGPTRCCVESPGERLAPLPVCRRGVPVSSGPQRLAQPGAC